jgi:hypothetical protein
MPRPRTLALVAAIATGLALVVVVTLSLARRTLEPVAPGSDRDEHGCLGSGGYSWCAREQRCVRPWELAAERNLPAGPAAFAEYCSRSKP